MRFRVPRFRRTGLIFSLVVLALVCVFLSPYATSAIKAISSGWNDTGASRRTADTKHGWNLILINRDFSIPEDYDVELTELSNGEKVDSRIYPPLQEMFDAARAEGLQLFVAAGYRTQEEQEALMAEKIRDYENEGCDREEAQRLAEQWVAIPGTSEHQIGIAVDINADNTVSTDEEVYSWLFEHGHEYGFIKRYLEDKTEVTGVINEPWHYRYVGREAAKEIHEKGICLEEYMEALS